MGTYFSDQSQDDETKWMIESLFRELSVRCLCQRNRMTMELASILEAPKVPFSAEPRMHLDLAHRPRGLRVGVALTRRSGTGDVRCSE